MRLAASLSVLALALVGVVFSAHADDKKIRVAVVDFDRVVDSSCSEKDGGIALARKLRANAETKKEEAAKAVASAKVKFDNKTDSGALEMAKVLLTQAQNDMARADSIYASAKIQFSVRSRNRIRAIAGNLGYDFVVSRVGLVALPANAVEVNITEQVIKACR